MNDIVKILFAICLFKKSPRDVPYSLWLLRFLIVIYGVIRFLMLAIDTEKLLAILQIIVEICISLGFCWLILYIEKKLHRYYQVSSALIGTDSIINFISLPGVATMHLGYGGWYVFGILLALIAWQCAVVAHIIHNALEKNLLYSSGLSLLYLLLSYSIITLLFPEVATAE